jgi:hypothetical protein
MKHLQARTGGECLKWVCSLLALAFCTGLFAAESIETIPLPGGNTLSFVKNFSTPTPKAVLILLVGSEGMLKIQKSEDGAFKYQKGNFLMRIRDALASDDLMTIAPDVPSDQASRGYTDAFRDSDRHLSDMRALIADVKDKYPQAKVFIVGTSRGSISSGVLALKLGHEVAGVIHTASMNGNAPGAGLPLWRLNYGLAKSKQLFIHHRDDNCKSTKFEPIKEKAETFQIELIEINGGHGDQNRDPCQAFSYHGFWGVEQTVVLKIKDWLSRQIN